MDGTDSMVFIPGGIFTRGSMLSPEEQPVMKVLLSSFYIDATPVTNIQFVEFIEADGYRRPEFWSERGWEYKEARDFNYPCYWFDSNWNQPSQPITGISWWEAMAYADFRKRTLPTEAQWEYAARGINERLYPWGNESPTLVDANFAEDCEPAELHRRSTSVFAHPKNKSPFGCIDMAGNVAEWCLDNASPNYLWDMERKDPLNLYAEDKSHAARGGCGLHNEDYVRCSSRDFYPPTVRDNIVGLRCVLNMT